MLILREKVGLVAFGQNSLYIPEVVGMPVKLSFIFAVLFSDVVPIQRWSALGFIYVVHMLMCPCHYGCDFLPALTIALCLPCVRNVLIP